ncbi:MAG: phosphoribosylanthranilate isomerase, partial [Solirubrobacteraceae bacterium]|nr:phosphoribosylanthranilate isomerase [Solirubrobacteraceae bacterium]
MSDVPPQVKICGITNLADGELAVELGAWALGMIFYEESPRRCSTAEAETIASALRRKVELCGVFVNAPLEQVVAQSEAVGLTLLQFNGEEGPSFCAEAARRTGARV